MGRCVVGGDAHTCGYIPVRSARHKTATGGAGMIVIGASTSGSVL
jgi:hypothetical protein